VWTAACENQGFIDSHSLSVSWTEVPKEFKTARREIHLLLKQASFDLGKLQFNTVVSAAMKILNVIDRLPGPLTEVVPGTAIQPIYAALGTEAFSILLRMLAPITPHIAQTLWKELDYGDDILAAPWPKVDEAALVQDEIELVIQVNGKLRGNLRVAKDAGKATLEQMALAHEAVQKQLAGAPPKKIIVVPGRLINVVA
jgi:leucyl-tRNA synthetase